VNILVLALKNDNNAVLNAVKAAFILFKLFIKIKQMLLLQHLLQHYYHISVHLFYFTRIWTTSVILSY